MRQHRNLIEKIIKFGNAYANGYTVQRDFGTTEEFSPSQIQVFEYILESEEKNENMSGIAKRLGVSRSLLSKNVKILTEKGMPEKFRRLGNKKDIYVKPTQKGREVYNTYVGFVCDLCFYEMFDSADQMSNEDKQHICDILECFANAFISYCVKRKPTEAREDILIRID